MSRLVQALCKGRHSAASCRGALLPFWGTFPGMEGRAVGLEEQDRERIEQEERARAEIRQKIEEEKKAENLEKAKKVGEDAAKKATKITIGCLVLFGICAILGLIFNTGDEDWQNQYYLADQYAKEAQGYYAVGEDELAREAIRKSMEHRTKGDRIKARSGGQ